MTTQVLIADDHPVTRLGLRAIISMDDRFHVAAEAACPDEVMQQLETGGVDLLLTDFHMPYGCFPDGLSMLTSIRRRYPKLPIVLITSVRSTLTLRYALEGGVGGIVDKSADLALLPDILALVASGSIYLSRGVRGLAEGDCCASVDPLTTLSKREVEEIRWYAGGLSITQIAAKLDRTVSTVSNNKIVAMKKLGVASNAELISLIQEHGLLARS